MAEYFDIETITEQYFPTESLAVILEGNEKLKNKGGDDLDEILERKCPAGKIMYFLIDFKTIEIKDA